MFFGAIAKVLYTPMRTVILETWAATKRVRNKMGKTM
jgi:hypothetical protein